MLTCGGVACLRVQRCGAPLRCADPADLAPLCRVVFHPKEPIVGSASSDKTIYLGELAQ